MPPARKNPANGPDTTPETGTVFRSTQERLTNADIDRKIKIASAPAWRPEAGTTLYGPTVLGIRKGDGQYGVYPILVIETEQGEFYSIHAFHTLLRNRLLELKPTPGTKLESLTYLGFDETNQSKKEFDAGAIKEADRTFYHNYLITMPDESGDFTWDEK